MQFVTRFLLLSVLIFIIIILIDSTIKKDSKILVSKITVTNIVQNSNNIKSFLNVFINTSKVFNETGFRQINSDSYEVDIIAKNQNDLDAKINEFRNEVNMINQKILYNVKEYFLNNKYTSGDINYPIDLFIIENNPNFLLVKVTKIRSRNSQKDTNLFIKFSYFYLLSTFLTIFSLLIVKNFKKKNLKKFINSLS